VIAPDDLALEFLINAFRLARGVDITLFEQRTQIAGSELTLKLAELRSRGLVAENPLQLKLTELGRRFMNDVLTSL